MSVVADSMRRYTRLALESVSTSKETDVRRESFAPLERDFESTGDVD